MVEIIPNWHPLFVHFTVALFSVSAGISVISYFLSYLRIFTSNTISEWEVVGRWCLWFSAIATILTVSAGLYAYYTVNHDAPSHAAMTVHRNWALPTGAAILAVVIWSGWRYYYRQGLTLAFIATLLLVQGLLLSTAWHGAELVYRYGLGVMSLPKSYGSGHDHGKEEMDGNMDHSLMPPQQASEDDGHQHDSEDAVSGAKQ